MNCLSFHLDELWNHWQQTGRLLSKESLHAHNISTLMNLSINAINCEIIRIEVRHQND